jgi:hypothetical protein
MARKVYVTVKTRLIIEVEEGVSIDDIIQEMDYEFISNTENADITDTEIIEYEITDSK